MKKNVYWFLAIVITLVLSIYQRMTGPTYPKKVTVELNGEQYKLKLPRSGVQQDELVTLKGIPSDTEAQLHYRRYPSGDDYTTVDFTWKDSTCQAVLPVQPVAGKLQYYITVGGKDYLADEPLLIRSRARHTRSGFGSRWGHYLSAGSSLAHWCNMWRSGPGGLDSLTARI